MDDDGIEWAFEYLPCDHRIATPVNTLGERHIIPTGEPLHQCCRDFLDARFRENFVTAIKRYAAKDNAF